MTTVLFACRQNAGRSQMALAFFNRFANPTKAVGLSAGTSPAGAVHPVVATAMREVGFDLSDVVPQQLTPELTRHPDVLITMGCGEECPFVPGAEVIDWELPDPKDAPIEQVRSIRDDIRERVQRLIRERGLD
jgi:arsenate reductase (thioredoxin)